VRDGIDGILVDPFDKVAVAEVLGRLLSDKHLRRSLADAGRARVGEFAWPVVAERYRELYASAVNGVDRIRQPAGAS
jgi:glycosyltransferase involved in cell wall biosynthesis